VFWSAAVGLACSPAPAEKEDAGAPACDPTAPPPASSPTFEVRGETEKGQYEPVQPDAELVRHSGPQGGQHVWIRVRVFANEERSFGFEARVLDGTGDLRALGNRGFTSCAGSWSKEREITVFLELPYEPLSGTLEVRVPSDPALTPFAVPVSVP
jgi:hypothetical protein